MGAGTIFLLLVVLVVVVVAVVLLTGAGGKLSSDREKNKLPSQGSDERPQHVAVSTDVDDTPEPTSRQSPSGV